MPFLNIGILISGLLAIAIPIIIHLLFRRRRKPVEWGAMRFVLEAYRKTQKRTTIERWLLLAARCLLVGAIAVALGRPLLQRAGVLASGGTGAGRSVYIVLDDGLISQAADSGLKRSIDHARAVLDSFGPGDRVGVVLAGGTPRSLVMPPSGDISGVRTAMERLTPTDAPSDLPGALALVAEVIRQSRVAAPTGTQDDYIIVASSFRAGSARLSDSLAKLPAGVTIIAPEPAGAPAGNVSIASVKPLRSVMVAGQNGLSQTVSVRLLRWGAATEAAGSTTLRVRPASVPESSVLPGLVKWSPGQREATATLVLDAPPAKSVTSSGVIIASIENDTIAGDNIWRLPLNWRETIRVGIIADASARGSMIAASAADRFKPAQWARLALNPSDSAGVETVDIEPAAVDTPLIAPLDAIMVLSPEALSDDSWRKLRAYTDAGGLLFVMPTSEAVNHTWTDAMNRGLGFGADVLRLPRTTKDYEIDLPGRLATQQASTTESDLLSAIGSEIDELARPVALLKVLAPTAGTGDSKDETRTILSGQDGLPILTAITRRATEGSPQTSRGLILYLAIALDLRWSDLPAKPLMLPLMQELVRQGIGRAKPSLVSNAGSRIQAPPSSVELRDSAGLLPPVTLDAAARSTEHVLKSGLFTATDAKGADRGAVAVNADPAAADTALLSGTGVQQWLQSAVDETAGGRVVMLSDAQLNQGSSAMSTSLAREDKPIATGPMLLAFAAGLALIEIALARAASRTSFAPAATGGSHA